MWDYKRETVYPIRDWFAANVRSFPDWFIYKEMEDGGLLEGYKSLAEAPSELLMTMEGIWRCRLADQLIKEREVRYEDT